MSNAIRRWTLVMVCGFAALGCYAHEYATVEAEAPAVDLELYPQTTFEGHVVYWIGGRWYAHDGGHWVYYRREPDTLYRYRARVQAAPPARRRHDSHERHHDERREGREHHRHEAPRAHRVD